MEFFNDARLIIETIGIFLMLALLLYIVLPDMLERVASSYNQPDYKEVTTYTAVCLILISVLVRLINLR